MASITGLGNKDDGEITDLANSNAQIAKLETVDLLVIVRPRIIGPLNSRWQERSRLMRHIPTLLDRTPAAPRANHQPHVLECFSHLKCNVAQGPWNTFSSFARRFFVSRMLIRVGEARSLNIGTSHGMNKNRCC